MKRHGPLKKHMIVLVVLLALMLALIGCAGIMQATSTTTEPVTETMTTTTAPTTTAQTTTETESTTPADTTAPRIFGVTDKVVHIGETVAYKQGVTVQDDMDPSPTLDINAEQVNISKVGLYTVIYTAKDASGNTTSCAATVKVVPQDSISTEQANALADEVLAQITTEDMSDSQKLDAVWWYVHNLGYVDIDYGEPDDYLDNGYFFITRMMGNCRCVYGASRLLLERLGWKCQKMYNREDAAQPHYWNLVSLDDGQTWFHFDPTCWGWDEEYEICMVSDEWILAYSLWHDMETYDWDMTERPPTPGENYDPDGFFGDRCLFDETGFYGYYYGEYFLEDERFVLGDEYYEDYDDGSYEEYEESYDEYDWSYEEADYEDEYDEEYYEEG